MSIIHDALKKTQAQLSKQNSPDPEPAGSSEFQSSKDVSKIYEKLYTKTETPRGPASRPLRASDAAAGIEPRKFSKKIFYPILAVLILSGILGGAYSYLKFRRPSLLTVWQADWDRILTQIKNQIFFETPAHSSKPAQLPALAPEETSAVTPAPPSDPKEKTTSVTPPKPAELVLNGIMMMDNEKAALINNRIYHVDDEIEGKKVVNITLDKVELEEAGQIITLRVK